MCHISQHLVQLLRKQSIYFYKIMGHARAWAFIDRTSSFFPSPALTEPKMAYRAERKFAASAIDEASEVKPDVEPKMAFRAEDKFAAPATDEAPEDKEGVVPDVTGGETDGEELSVHIVHLIRQEGEEPEAFDIRTPAASAIDEASEVKPDVEPKMAFRAEDKFAAPATDEDPEDKEDVVPDVTCGETDGEAPSVHIVHLIRPEGEEPEAFDIRTLASVIGSEEAAKEAVVYHYTLAASGFAARLTPKQVAHLSEKPEVLMVTPDTVCQLIR